MGTNRLEAFSDGVIAIIVTIMVLELKLPANGTWDALLRTWPTLVSYVLSFAVVAIMWVNHHALISGAKRVTGLILWANNLLLFWMSLIPFATAYLGQHPGDALPTALYGAVLTMCGLGFTWLRVAIARHQEASHASRRLNRKLAVKNWLSVVLYGSTVPIAFVDARISYGIFILIPVVYFWPETFRERTVREAEGSGNGRL